jgi:uncharacterized coiled-coil protein SlyX
MALWRTRRSIFDEIEETEQLVKKVAREVADSRKVIDQINQTLDRLAKAFDDFTAVPGPAVKLEIELGEPKNKP